ncbi:MAG: hypothetical protein WDN45_01790 [Caulobacteraceae bacterium]
MSRNLPPQDEAHLPKELYVLPPVSHAYTPKKTAWGDPDLRGMFPIDAIGGLSLQRTPAQGKRVWLTDAEYTRRSPTTSRSSRTPPPPRPRPTAWATATGWRWTGAGRRTSMLIDPDNGLLPPLTEWGKKMTALGPLQLGHRPDLRLGD